MVKTSDVVLLGAVGVGAFVLLRRFGETPPQREQRIQREIERGEFLNRGLGGIADIFQGAGQGAQGLGFGIQQAGAGLGSGIGQIGLGVGQFGEDLLQATGVQLPSSFFEGLGSRISQEFEEGSARSTSKFEATLDEEIAKAEAKARGQLRRREIFEAFKTRATDFFIGADSSLAQQASRLRSGGRGFITSLAEKSTAIGNIGRRLRRAVTEFDFRDTRQELERARATRRNIISNAVSRATQARLEALRATKSLLSRGVSRVRRLFQRG